MKQSEPVLTMHVYSDLLAGRFHVLQNKLNSCLNLRDGRLKPSRQTAAFLTTRFCHGKRHQSAVG